MARPKIDWINHELAAYGVGAIQAPINYNAIGVVTTMDHPQTALSRPVESTIGGKPELSHLIDLNGNAVKLSANKTTLIYYFSPTCGWCKLNLPGITSLAKQFDFRSDYEIIGMVQDATGLKDYLAQHLLPFKVVIDSDPFDISTMDLRGTPQTVVINKGEVVHNWSGAYQFKVKDSIQSVLDVSLPDIYAVKQLNVAEKRGE